jgi:hypothetical protein
VNLVTGAVILAMLHFANSRFETIVVSALVIIYATVIGTYMSLGYVLSRKWNIDLTRHIAIAKALHLNTALEEEVQKENEEEDAKSRTSFWITATFNWLFGLIATGNLLFAMLR